MSKRLWLYAPFLLVVTALALLYPTLETLPGWASAAIAAPIVLGSIVYYFGVVQGFYAMRRGARYLRAGAYPEALTAYRGLLEAHPQSTIAWYGKGIAHFGMDEWAAAEHAFSQAEAFGQDPDTAAYQRAMCRYHLGRPTEAIPGLQATLQREPGNGRALLTLASCLRRTGKLAEARLLLDLGVALLKPELRPDGYALLAAVHQAEGNNGEARKTVGRAKESGVAEEELLKREPGLNELLK